MTGHRVLADLPRVEAGIDRALDRIEMLFPDGPLRVLSSLAEGADRLVVERALDRPRIQTLIVFVPRLPDRAYEDTFADEASIRDFHALCARAADIRVVSSSGPEHDAYAAVNEQMLRQIDALLAIWDGQPSTGPGGTGSMVARARNRGLPIAWVHAGNRRPDTLVPTHLGDEQGTVTFEGLP